MVEKDENVEALVDVFAPATYNCSKRRWTKQHFIA